MKIRRRRKKQDQVRTYGGEEAEDVWLRRQRQLRGKPRGEKDWVLLPTSLGEPMGGNC